MTPSSVGILADSLSVRFDSRGLPLALLRPRGCALSHSRSLGRLGLQPLEPTLRLGLERALARSGIGRALLGQDLIDRLLHLGHLAQRVLALAALGFRGIAGQLHPVDGEPLPPNASLTIADGEHLREELADRIP